jgi:ferredoxin
MPKIIHYRDKCIGCGVCYEMQPEIWRMSRKDGKAVLLNATLKKETSILTIPDFMVPLSEDVAVACPVKIIKVF